MTKVQAVTARHLPRPVGQPLEDSITVHYRLASDGIRGPDVPELVAVDVRVSGGQPADVQLRTDDAVYRYEVDNQGAWPCDEESASVMDADWVSAAVEVADVADRLGL